MSRPELDKSRDYSRLDLNDCRDRSAIDEVHNVKLFLLLLKVNIWCQQRIELKIGPTSSVSAVAVQIKRANSTDVNIVL